MISSTPIQFSVSEATGYRLATFEWEYPRFIHAEVLTHRALSRNAGSSRAIPVASMLELARDKMFTPEFKYNQRGMQPADYLNASDMDAAKAIWQNCAGKCIEAARELDALKVHKQWANRMLEWFSPIKIVATATDWDNFLWLRNDSEAQDELEILAAQVEHQIKNVVPFLVPEGHVHVPYVERTRIGDDVQYFVDDTEVALQIAPLVSASICAQMSYRKADKSILKAHKLYDQFMKGRRVHASPFEHQAFADDVGSEYSGNLRGWTQLRHLVSNNTCLDIGQARMMEMISGV